MKIDRISNTTRNIKWGIVEKVLALIIPFVTRTILLKYLGAEYLGLNSLFSSVLQVLNLADFGIGTAIVYSMYKPIAENDKETICSLLKLYERLFKIIGMIILALGLCMMPFLGSFIHGNIPNDVNIRLVFGIYLANTVISYFLFAYKRSILTAFHRNDIITRISIILLICQSALQIGILCLITNYYYYLLTLPLITIANNFITAYVTKKHFPDYISYGKVSIEMKNSIKKQVGGLFINKLCEISRNSLDSIFISMFVGLKQVAMYSNYFYILNGIHMVKGVINTSMLAGVGNSIVCESEKKNYVDFRKFNFLYMWISGWCCCCMMCLYQHFMRLWVGDELVLPFYTMLMFCIYLFAISLTDIKNVYMNAAGLWWQDRRRTIVEFVLNVVLNYSFGRMWGIVGILLATIITVIAVNVFYGALILFKNYFKEESVMAFYKDCGFYLCITAFVAFCTYIICELLPGMGVFWFITKLLICLILPNALYYLCYRKTRVFCDSKQVINNIANNACIISKLKKRSI